MFTRALLIALFMGCIGPISAVAASAAMDADPPVFAERTVTTSSGTFAFRVFVPVHRDPHKKSPVILFLHGAGERGSDNRAQTTVGIPLLIAQDPEFPAVVVCPQCKGDNAWWTEPAMEDLALKALDQSIQEFNCDPRRVYLTGLSMGGYGTWDLAQKYPDRWAAIAPCCGGLIVPWLRTTPLANPYTAVAKKVVDIPTWVFHGEMDSVIPVSESRQMVGLLYMVRAGRKSPDLKYTEYPGVGHDSWNKAYKEPGLLTWLFAQKKKK